MKRESFKMKKIYQLTILLLAFTLLFTGCAKQAADQPENTGAAEKPVIRFGMMSSSDVIPFELINENGLADKYGFTLELEVFTSAKDRDAALQAGELDGVITDYVGIVMYQNAGLDVRITGITDGDYILVAGKNTGITDISQIEGMSIAISENTLIDYTLDTILAHNNLSSDSVKKEIVPRIPDRLELLRNDKIDLGLMPEPFATLAINDGSAVLGSANEFDLYPSVSAFSKKALDEKGAAISDLYKAYNEAVDYMNRTDISEYEDAVIKAVGYPEEMKGKIKVKPFRTSTLPPKKDVDDAVQWASSRGLGKSTLTYDQLTYDIYTE
jgi:NitT/TauT family transport system substrate-binding protein